MRKNSCTFKKFIDVGIMIYQDFSRASERESDRASECGSECASEWTRQCSSSEKNTYGVEQTKRKQK